jgi:hypothetical protein
MRSRAQKPAARRERFRPIGKWRQRQRLEVLMDSLLVKIFAVALTFSQVATGREPRTTFDPIADQQNVVDLLRAGCGQMRRAFDLEAFNLDDLIATAMDDPGGHLRGACSLPRAQDFRSACRLPAVDWFRRGLPHRCSRNRGREQKRKQIRPPRVVAHGSSLLLSHILLGHQNRFKGGRLANTNQVFYKTRAGSRLQSAR